MGNFFIIRYLKFLYNYIHLKYVVTAVHIISNYELMLEIGLILMFIAIKLIGLFTVIRFYVFMVIIFIKKNYTAWINYKMMECIKLKLIKLFNLDRKVS